MIYVIYIGIAIAALLYLAWGGCLFINVVSRAVRRGQTLTLRGIIKLMFMAAFWPVTLAIFWIDTKRSDPRG